MKYITYFRVSTQQQGRSGLGLDAQEASVYSYLINMSGEVIGSFKDIESGKNNKRSGLADALRRCRLTGATLLISTLDRLSRDKEFLSSIIDSKVAFTCTDMPEASQTELHNEAAFIVRETKLIGARTKAALAAAKARGVKLGNIGNLTNTDTTAAVKANTIKADARNADIYEIITELRQEHGQLTKTEIAKLLNEAGYQTARGSVWRCANVHRVITSVEKQGLTQ